MPIRTTHLELLFINQRAFLHSSQNDTPPSTKPLVYLFGGSVCIFIPLKCLGFKWLEVFFMLDCFQSCIISLLCALDWRHFKDCHLHAINGNPSLWSLMFLGHHLSHSVFCQRNLKTLMQDILQSMKHLLLISVFPQLIQIAFLNQDRCMHPASWSVSAGHVVHFSLLASTRIIISPVFLHQGSLIFDVVSTSWDRLRTFPERE